MCLVDGVCSWLPCATGIYLNGVFELWIVFWLTVPACPNRSFLTSAVLKGLTLQGLMFVRFILVCSSGFDVCMLYTCEGIDFVDLTGERIHIYMRVMKYAFAYLSLIHI